MSFNNENLYNEYSAVIELQKNNFQIKNSDIYVKNIKLKNKFGLIMIYAPWCAHCINMSELWIELAIQYNNVFLIMAINSENSELSEILDKLNIKGYPVIKIKMPSGKLIDFNYNMNRDEMIYFITSKI